MAIVLATVASHSNLEQTMNAWLSQTQRDEFRHRGVTCLRGALESDEMTVLRAAFDWTLANPGRGASRVAPGMPGTLYGDLANSESFGAYRNVNTKTSLPSIIAELFSTPDVWYMYEQVFLKTGGDDAPARRTPWHQDESYLPVTGEDLAVAWISFGPLSAVESLEFVVGSHRGTLYDGSRFDPSDDTIPLYGTGELPRLPDIEANRADYDICSFSVDPGDIVFFHPAMLHRWCASTAVVKSLDVVTSLFRRRLDGGAPAERHGGDLVSHTRDNRIHASHAAGQTFGRGCTFSRRRVPAGCDVAASLSALFGWRR